MRRYSVAEAAEELGVSASLVYSLLLSRRIRHERHGLGRGRYVIPGDALEEYRSGRIVCVEAVLDTKPQKLRHVVLR